MATAFLVLLSLVALAWVLLALSPAHRATFRDELSSKTPFNGQAPLPPVTVIVPARNEAPMLPRTVPGLCRQEYPDLRVVVVDDQSEDDSREVLRQLRQMHPNLSVVEAPPRPDGWCGKPWAVTRGFAMARTDLLLFTDADCEFHPLALRQAMRFLQAGGFDLLTLIPRMTFGSTAERIALPGLVTALSMLFPAGWSNDPKRAVALAAGAFILVRRAAYEKAGGHEAVRGYVIEDINLVRKIKESGATVHVRLTPDLVTTRMYEGMADLWEGLTKNAYAGMEYQPLRFWLEMAVGLLGAVLPPAYLVISIVWTARQSHSVVAWVAVALSALTNLLIVAMHRRAIRFLRLPRWHALLMPLSSGFYALIAVSSAWQHHFRGGNVWKGRRYGKETVGNATEPSTAPSET